MNILKQTLANKNITANEFANYCGVCIRTIRRLFTLDDEHIPLRYIKLASFITSNPKHKTKTSRKLPNDKNIKKNS